MGNILILTHEDAVPVSSGNKPSRQSIFYATERDVRDGLESLGYHVHFQGFGDTLHQVHRRIAALNPQVVVNLVEHFRGEVTMDHCAASLLELEGVPYTGCGARGLMLARDKSLAKKILSYHGLPTPAFQVFPRDQHIKFRRGLSFPIIVKSLCDDGSYGITRDSLVTTPHRLHERVQYVHEHLGADALAEEFIAGQELAVGLLGMQRLRTLPVWQIFFHHSKDANKEFYTHSAKWRTDYRQRLGIQSGPADVSKDLAAQAQKLAKQACRVLGVNGYARVDFRVNSAGNLFILEVNPNPDLAKDDEFASSAAADGMSYESLLASIVRQAQHRRESNLLVAC